MTAPHSKQDKSLNSYDDLQALQAHLQFPPLLNHSALFLTHCVRGPQHPAVL
jgi:hypothetical protein